MKLELLFVIVDKSKTRKATETLLESGANALNVMPGAGTAPTAMGDVFGGDSAKSVITATIDARYMPSLRRKLHEKLEIGTKSVGVAFTVPVCTVAGKATLRILAGESAEESK